MSMPQNDEIDIQALVDSYIQQQIELYGDDPVLDQGVMAAFFRAQNGEDPWHNLVSLQELEEAIRNCLKCPLGATRQNFVFGSGDPHADIVLIGEAPGATEDQLGQPFVGEAGHLLDKILASIDFKRQDVCNILKCRPPANRDPQSEEIEQCAPFLLKQIELIKPEFILCLGRHAAHTLLKTTQALSVLRGREHQWNGIRLLVTYHPAALLRYPQFKPETWEDVKLLRRLYDDYMKHRPV